MSEVFIFVYVKIMLKCEFYTILIKISCIFEVTKRYYYGNLHL